MEREGLVLTLDELAGEARISSRTLYRLIGQGVGPKITQLGGRRVVLRETAQAWLREREAASGRSGEATAVMVG